MLNCLNSRPLSSLAVRTGLLSLLCLALLVAVACGKKGYPVPRDSSRSFSWKEVEVKAIGSCLAFSGSFEGAFENFDGVRLEVAPLSGPEDCPGCPFVAQDVMEFSPKDAGFDRKTGTMSFSYCPQPANAYRWRIAGISIFNRLPHATMNDRIVIINHDAFAEADPAQPQEEK